MKAFIVISIILLLLIWLYIARNWKQGATFFVPQVHKEMLETFAVLGGQNDVRYGRIGSTLHNTGTLGKWIKVASFSNANPMQNHALTLDVFPQNKGLGTSKQSFSFLVRNSTTDQDGDPVFIQQNQYDGTNWTKATFTTASVIRNQDSKNKLSNTYDLYLQLGTENAFGIPVTWYLNDFVDTDMIAVADVDQVDAPPTGTNVYKPRVINQDQAQTGQTGQSAQTTSDKFQLGNKWLLSGVGDKDANDEWLRLKGLDGSTYYGGFAAGKLWSGGDVSSGGKVTSNQVQLGNKWLLSGVGDGDANDEWLRLKALNGKDYYGGFAAGKGWFGGDVTVSGALLHNGADINRHPRATIKSSIDQTKVWDTAGGENTGNGANIQIWDNYRGSGQLASYIPATGQILWANTGRCLDLPNNDATQGNQLRQWDCNSSPAQAWNLGAGGAITHKASGKCVDLANGNTANGTKIQLWPCNGSTAQKWLM